MFEQYHEVLLFLRRMDQKHILPMTDLEYERAQFVSSLLDGSYSLQMGDGNFSLEEVRSQAIDLLKIYDAPSLLNTLSSVPIQKREDSYLLNFNTTILADQEDGLFYPVEGIDSPSSLTSFAPFYLAHEFHHVLKDTSFDEYTYMLRYADVIPQFFELIVGENTSFEKPLIQNRLAMLKQMGKCLDEKMNRNSDNFLLEVLDSKKCQYFNSFYYSTLLYILYLENPRKVLMKVQEVLKREKTTYQMLDELHLLEKNMDNDVQSGIQYFKKYSS